MRKVKTETIGNQKNRKKACVVRKIIVNLTGDIDFAKKTGYTEISKKATKEDVPMKAFWNLLVVLGVIAAAGAAVFFWLREKKNREVWLEDDCCTWEDGGEEIEAE